jgi:cytochrome c551/c552
MGKTCNQSSFGVVFPEIQTDLKTMKHFSLATALTFAAVTVMAARLPDPSKLPPASAQQGLTFEKDIQPIFKEACVRCHGEDRPKHGLRLDNLEGVLKGSKDRKVVVPGHSEQSSLVFAVSDIDGKISMPPKPRPPRAHVDANGVTNTPPPMAPPQHPWKALTTEQVGLIRAWIDQGAKP